MESQDYNKSFSTKVTSKEAFEKITRVADWWAKHFEGKSQKSGDVFTVRFGPNGEKDMYKIRVTEATQGKRIVWKVIDSKQDWVKRPTEWTGTEIVWDISAEKDGTKIMMTHKGLNQQLECYEKCVGGWNYLTSESLPKLLQENVGKPT
jgi:hypothetical protein